MPFPEVERVVYEKNPLVKVVCQLRFPPILKIETELPAKFQDLIRDQFPNFSQKTEYTNEIVVAGNPQGQTFLNPLTSRQVESKNYEFTDSDKTWTVNLTRSFVSLTTSKYIRWEEFRTNLEKVIEAVFNTYSPPFLSRLGLRYVDVFRKKHLSLEGAEWKDLLQPHILGMLGSAISDCVQNQSLTFDIVLADKESRAKIVSSSAIDGSTMEPCYMIDSDFYLQKKLPKAEIPERLDYLHKRTSRLMRWAITDRLHEALGPKPV